MKAILGSLLCFVLFASECFALKGGPPYPGATSVVGIYAGVLQPAFDPTDPFSANSLGVFTLAIPSVGASVGNFLMFTHGRVFGGTIQGLTNPNNGALSAVLDATFTYTLSFIDSLGVLQTVDVTASVTGPLTATVSPTRSPNGMSVTKIRGSATAFISSGAVEPNGDPTIDGTLSLDVMGFQQTSTDSTGGTLTPP